MTIRPCRASDAASIALLSGELGYPAAEAAALARVEDLLGRSDHALLAAERAGEVVGWLHMRETRALESEPAGEIAGLVVGAGHRGQGSGRALVEAGLAWAAARGLAEVRVRSNVVRDDAHRFYRGLGFAQLKTQAVFSRSPRPPA